jgi:hypothetical protein
MVTATLSDLLNPLGITIPDGLLADLKVPVLAGPQRQGDVLILPTGPAASRGDTVPAAGVAVVRGEATGNTHLLQPASWGGPIFWTAAPQRAGSLLLGTLTVPDGSCAYLIHTDEHGANGIGAGTYALHGKREQADEARRVAD